MIIFRKTTQLFFIFAAIFYVEAAIAKTEILVTIKPLHSLVQAVLGDQQSAQILMAKLLMDRGASPHNFKLRPSQIRLMQNAEIIFYIDDHFETFLQQAFAILSDQKTLVPIGNLEGLQLLKIRKNRQWGHGDHSHVEDQVHVNDQAQQAEDHHDHSPLVGEIDLHFWLNPNNAIILVDYIAEVLSLHFPQSQQIFAKNAEQFKIKLQRLDEDLQAKLSPVRNKAYIVFHDAYQYFEQHFGLKSVGTITLPHERSMSISQIKEIRKNLQDEKVVCVFKEPQFNDRAIETIIEGSDVRQGILDPIGLDIQPGPDLYFQLLENLAENLKTCLK